MADLSNSSGSIPLAVFKDMVGRVDAFIENKKENPGLVYLNTSKSDYISFVKFQDMRNRYNNYKASKGEPTIIYINKIAPVPVTPVGKKVGQIQTALESFLGPFNNFTEFYNKCKGRGYGHYYNDIYTLDQEIVRLKNRSGLNCADSSQLFGRLGIEMGYKIAYEHVICKGSGGHMRLLIDGKEFGDHGTDARNWKLIDPAACLSVGSQYAIGNVWCADGKRVGITKPDGAYIGENLKWMISDDGRT